MSPIPVPTGGAEVTGHQYMAGEEERGKPERTDKGTRKRAPREVLPFDLITIIFGQF